MREMSAWDPSTSRFILMGPEGRARLALRGEAVTRPSARVEVRGQKSYASA